MSKALKVFAGNSNPELARSICGNLGVDPGLIEFVCFSNENIKVKICENVRGCDVFFIQTSAPSVSDNLMELLIALDALKYASASRITAVLPYYPYALADSKDEPRISIAGRLMADLITEAGADRILTMTLHSPQIVGFSRIPVDQLSGVPIICNHYSGFKLDNAVVAAPDISRAKVTEIYSKRLGLPLAVIDRRRDKNGQNRVHGVIGDVEERNVIFFDDEIITGASVCEGAKAVIEKGANKIYAGCVHGTLAGTAVDNLLGAGVQHLAVTDTIPLETSSENVAVCSVAELFANAIKAIHDETSISALF
ncbi:MAG: ribose-phosphate diphosphokinase [Candidatus Latescibacterota bacterium]|nr:ribose-phosphate diphosphokinase [Candidatus Latescibacterota bacterium]